MRKLDRDALRRAVQMVKARDPASRRQILDKLTDEPWEDAAEFAAYSCQCHALSLKPWQPPPMHADEDRPRDEHPTAGRVAAWELRRRLLKAGLSEFERDPVAALETAAARQRAESPPVERLKAH